MISFTIIKDGEPQEFTCGDSCPAVDYFEPVGNSVEAPDIYDDYFRRLAPSDFKHVQEKGITAMNGCNGAAFWSYLMELTVYVADGIFENGLAESYENAKERIQGLSDEKEQYQLKVRMLERISQITAKLRNPGDEIDSLKSFGAFIHLLTMGMTDFIGKEVTVMVVQAEDLNSDEDLAPFLEYFNDKEP